MKKIAIFGFGNHVKKNIIPAVLRSDKLEISFIVRRKLNNDVLDGYQDIKFITLDESFKIINHKNTNLIYISNPTSEHFKWSKQAILNNFNVLCEKPLTDSYKKTKNLIELAKINSVKIQEVCIYKYHKQFLYLKNLISTISNDINFIETAFCIPSLPKNDFRYQKSLGGGATFDLGYYPTSIILSLFGKPKSIESRVNFQKKLGVDVAGSAKFQYKNFYASANWEIGSDYENHFTIHCNEKKYKFDRIFSKPYDFESSVLIHENDSTEEIIIGHDDHFVNIFESNMSDINNSIELLNSEYLESFFTKEN